MKIPIIKTTYFPQLDGIRAIAIALVLLFHWFPSTHFVNKIPNGTIGVTLFFVLSGFLITDILLRNIPDSKSKIWQVYKIFIIRRTLRIFPIYFIVLIVVSLLPRFSLAIDTDFYKYPMYYWTYFYNHLLDKTDNWQDVLSPYWTLAVEEQFYVVWAVIILSLPSKKLIKYFLWVTIFLGILFRYYFIYLNGGHGMITLTCIDTFAWGAILAFYKLENEEVYLTKILNYALLPSLLVFIYIVGWANSDDNIIKILFLRTVLASLSASLILKVIQEKAFFFKQLLALAPVTFIGRISYGIYVYHMILPLLIGMILRKLNVHLPIENHLVSLLILIVGSYLSWLIIENPINGLKKYFNYPAKK